MNLSARDRRALGLLGAALAVMGILWITTDSAPEPVTVTQATIPLAEKRLERARRLAAEVPGKLQTLQQAQQILAQRERGLIQADTAAQAQAQLLQIVRRVARTQQPPLEVRAVETGQARTFGEHYGEVLISVSADCRIEQLLNLLADLTAQPEAVATEDLRIQAANGRDKIIPVRLTVAGLVPRRLIPERKGMAPF